jgi:tetratricopeptide (TPR) repeat protein
MTGQVLVAALFLALMAAPRAVAQVIADEQSRRQALELYRTGQEFMSSEQFEKAADAFTKAIGKDALLTVAHYQLGQAYMNLKRYASATRAYKGAIDAMAALHHLAQSSRFQVDKARQEEIRELRVEI